LVLWLVAAASVAAAAASQFPASIYPAPVNSRGGGLDACPNPSGLVSFTAATTKRAVQIASSYDRISLAVDLRNSDRAWWPQVRALWRPGKPEQGAANQVVDGSSLGSKIAYRGVVRHSCGSALVTKSLTVYLAPRQRHGCDACVASVFVIDRRGRALIYWLN
jgi:hypothetical protein